AEAGVEVREGFTVDELLVTDETVVGVRGHGRDGRPVEERTRLVIGADGVNSFVARSVRAPEYDVRPVAACGYYSYFSGVRQDDIELYVRNHHAFGGAPTSKGMSGAHSRPRRTSRLACARAVVRTRGMARQACPATSADRMAKDGRSSVM